MHPSDGFPSARSLRIGVAAVAGVIVLLAGLLIGRATASGGTSAPTSSGRTSTGPAPSVPGWATGATRMDHGVPVGYAHTQDGAADAARNYDLALSATPLTFDPAADRTAESFLEVSSERGALAARIERGLAASAPLITAIHSGHTTRAVPFVLTTRVTSYTGDDAEVVVWGGVVLASDGVMAPQLSLVESTYSLRWLGDWRIADGSASAGPGISSSTTPAQTNALPVELSKDAQGIGNAVP